MSPLVLIAFLALAGSHALVLAQIQKCSAICTPKDGRWSYNNNDSRNTLLKIDFTADNIMECTYGLVTPTYKCRYNVTNGAKLPGDNGWCYPAEGPYCGPSHPAGTMCNTSCSDQSPLSPYDTEITCQQSCHYDRNSGVLTKATSNTCFGGIGANCGQNPELLPDRWTATIPCAADTTGTGSQVLPGNVAIPLLTLGDGYEIKASDCIQRCTTLGHSFAAVENSTTCYCGSKIAANVVSVDPSQCQIRCATPKYGSNYPCGGKSRLQVYGALGCAQPRCPKDLTGSSGTLSSVESTVFKCSYPQGSCTWFTGNGYLRNVAQSNCPKTVSC